MNYKKADYDQLQNQVRTLISTQSALIKYTENIQRQLTEIRNDIKEERKDHLEEIQDSVDFWNGRIEQDEPSVVSLEQFIQES
jgi:CHASE3 domain sensor protein